jgi:hypothetical protein
MAADVKDSAHAYAHEEQNWRSKNGSKNKLQCVGYEIARRGVDNRDSPKLDVAAPAKSLPQYKTRHARSNRQPNDHPPFVSPPPPPRRVANRMDRGRCVRLGDG